MATRSKAKRSKSPDQGHDDDHEQDRVEHREEIDLGVIPFEPDGLPAALVRLRRDHGITRISAIGGRSTASSLIDAGLVQDICLTTTARSAGEPNTPFYEGPPLAWRAIIQKDGTGIEEGVRFEHLRPSI